MIKDLRLDRLHIILKLLSSLLWKKLTHNIQMFFLLIWDLNIPDNENKTWVRIRPFYQN